MVKRGCDCVDYLAILHSSIRRTVEVSEMHLSSLGLALAASEQLVGNIQLPLLGDKSPFHWKQCTDNDPHYQCGYLEVPLDYTNASDPRTVTIATTMYQPRPGHKSARTLVVEPGGVLCLLSCAECPGPGGSGTEYIWRKGPTLAGWYTGNQFDVLGFDPRGEFG